MARLNSESNILASVNPILAAEWHPTKNEELTPYDVTASSGRMVWWLGKCGHEWQAVVYGRTEGNGCPVCSGKTVLAGFNDLATKRPDLAAEWHPTRNESLTSHDVTVSSRKKVWWFGKCGHEWQAVVYSRTEGKECPVCSGRLTVTGINDLATKYPNLADEWHPTKNEELSPQDVSAYCKNKVWWLGKCGHEWQAAIYSRTEGAECPICAGKIVLSGFNDLGTKNAKLAADWHPTKNGDLTPQDVTVFSKKMVWWLCSCGHEWQTSVAYRSQRPSCSHCTKRGRPKKKIIEYKNPND